MKKQMHSGHVHYAVHRIPSIPYDCTPVHVSLNSDEINEALSKIGGDLLLPDMPKEILAIKHELTREHPNLRHIVHLIEVNPAISGEILGMVSSPAFQRQLVRKIEIYSLTQCISLIGLTQTYQLALAAAIKQMATDEALITKILEHAAKTAYACAEISGYLPIHEHQITQETAYLFGLYLHGGMLSLAARYPTHYAKVYEQSLSLPDAAHQMECERVASHTLLGVLTAQKWGLDPNRPSDLDLLLAIAHHHHPNLACISQERVRVLIAIGLLAQTMVSEMATQAYQSQVILDQSKQATALLGLSNDALSNIRRNLNHDWFGYT